MVNEQKLRGRIVERYGTLGNFAKAKGCTIQSLSYKIRNRGTMSTKDIESMCRLLDIQKEEIPEYFFTD